VRGQLLVFIKTHMANKNPNPGNFANDPERAREAGREGGKASHSSGNKGNEQSGDAASETDTDMDLSEDMDTV
jgi:uncharacterized protein